MAQSVELWIYSLAQSELDCGYTVWPSLLQTADIQSGPRSELDQELFEELWF